MISNELTFRDFRGKSIEPYVKTHYVNLIFQAVESRNHEIVETLKWDLLRFAKSSDFYKEIPAFLDILLSPRKNRIAEYWKNYLQKIDAIHLENYEQAAKNRDRIHEIEALLNSATPLVAGALSRAGDSIQCKDKEEFLRYVHSPVLPSAKFFLRVYNNGFSWLFWVEDEQWVHKRCESLPATEPEAIKELILDKEMRIRREKFSTKHLDALIDGLYDAEGELKNALLDLAIAQYMLMLEEEEKFGKRKAKSAADD